ncbi:MAG: sulfatase-like hydrolase/transferase, partial [Chloroflexota bacterium]
GWDTWREETLARQKAMGLMPDHVELPPRNEGVKAWDECSDDEKRLFCRYQEAFAAMLDHTDAQIGRLMAHLESIGVYDNTIFILVSDNGASQEGGPNGTINEFTFFNFAFQTVEESIERIDSIGTKDAHNNYPWGWAMAGNTPLKRYKQNTHDGGIRDPLIISWRNGISASGKIRHQFHHATDIVPTLLEVLDIPLPETIKGVAQQPIEGVSMAYSFEDGTAATRKEVQYFEMMGHRGIWKDGWKAVTFHPSDSGGKYEKDKWELYHVAEDIVENNDLAAENPEKLQELIDAWWVEAEKYNVLPLDDRMMTRMSGKNPVPTVRTPTRLYTYYPSKTLIPENLAVNVRRRSHVISAEVDVGANANGVILSLGGAHGGWAFFMLDGKLAYTENYLHLKEFNLLSDGLVPAGKHTLHFVFQRQKPHNGTGYFFVGDQQIGQGFIPQRTPNVYSISEGLMCGYSGFTAVSTRYQSPFDFSGTLHKVVVNVEKTSIDDFEAQMKIALATQ